MPMGRKGTVEVLPRLRLWCLERGHEGHDHRTRCGQGTRLAVCLGRRFREVSTHADPLACRGGGECGGMVWGRAVPHGRGGAELLFTGGDRLGGTTERRAHRAVGVGQVLRAAVGLCRFGSGVAVAIGGRGTVGARLTLGADGGIGSGLRGGLLAAAEVGGVEPPAIRRGYRIRGTHGLGSAVRDVARRVAGRESDGVDRGICPLADLGPRSAVHSVL
jgi:hypothetical protein